MLRSTQLVKVLAISLCLSPALAACSFGGGDGEDCSFEFKSLCGLTFAGTKTINSQVLDTSVDSSCSKVVPADDATGFPELCVISAATIEVASGATLRATGSRPLVLAASETIQILGTIDASSKRATTVGNQPESLGAGAESAPCAAFARAVVDDQEGASGGAGGSLRGGAGAGGKGRFVVLEGLPNPVMETAKLDVLRGGCRGQAGGSSAGRANGGAGGAGGAGGGSVYLVSKMRIQIQLAGAITVNGAGGGGAAIQAGGGGGGSGGLIVLEAPTILHVGRISANGGGGGAGGFDNGLMIGPGGPGADGAVGNAAAAGGTNPSTMGHGASGAANSFDAASAGADSAGGGGGGGGGVGRIHVLGTVTGNGGVSSPPVE